MIDFKSDINNWISATSSPLERITNPFALLDEQITRWMTPLVDLRDNVINVGKVVSESIDRTVLEFSPVFDSLSRHMVVISEQLQAGFRQMDEDAVWLFNLGWPLPMYAPATFARDIREMVGDNPTVDDRKEIDAVMVEFHSADVLRHEILGSWTAKEFLRTRLPILRDAVEAHIEVRHCLSTTALLPQIEGIVSDLTGHRGWLNQKRYLANTASVLEQTAFEKTNAAFLDYFRDNLLGDFLWGDPIPLLNRHAILHGADTNYGTETNSLRVVLALDFLISRASLTSAQ